MQRDWACIRAILTAIEETPTLHLAVEPSTVGHWDSETVSWHMKLLADAGLIRAAGRNLSGTRLHYVGLDLTWDGHELLAKLRARGAWEFICAQARERGLDLTFEVVKALATKYVDRLIGG